MRRTYRKSVLAELGKKDKFQREEMEWASLVVMDVPGE